MPELFKVETDRALLAWSSVGSRAETVVSDLTRRAGRLEITPRRSSLTFGSNTWRAAVPDGAAGDPKVKVGPRLYEEQNYSIYLTGRRGAKVELCHRDPVLRAQLQVSEAGTVQHGIINFGSQVGRAEFSVLVDGESEFDFVVEVFPSKLDYEQDYHQLVAEVQDILAGLVVEYLRATFQVGESVPTPQPHQVEWLTLLRHVADDLENALRHITYRPRWGLSRGSVNVRAKRLRRTDNAVRRAVLRGRGSGPLRMLNANLPVRERLVEQRARPTLDTPEHRWLAAQVARIRRRLAELKSEERTRLRSVEDRYGTSSTRSQQVIEEIGGLEARMARLERLEPLAAAQGRPQPGFVSLQMMSTTGYREAYRACLVLSMGLRLTGGPVRMSIKDLHELYEYWCYLAVLRLLSEKTGQAIPARQLLTTSEHGLRVRVKKGRSTSVSLNHGTRKITLAYNPLWSADDYLTAQQPDLVLTIEEDDWPRARMILDAKYRVDNSSRYQDRFGIAGPPDDAINVLHRYRDAILERDERSNDLELKRTVVEGAVLYPLRVDDKAEYESSRLSQSLQRIGIGALPFLPGETRFVDEWLTSLLERGGWTIADRGIPHRAAEWSADGRRAATEYVLIGILRGGDEARHLDWIRERQLYYVRQLHTQRRQYNTRWVALYSPSALRRPGAVVHAAPVTSIDVVMRSEIPTPWYPRQDRDEPQVLYTLGRVEELERPIENQAGTRFSQHRWTSRLALGRARKLRGLFLETEPEWRLWEDLHAAGIPFELKPGKVRTHDADDPRGRAWFVGEHGRAQYRGIDGFFFQSSNQPDRYLAGTGGVVALFKLGRTSG